VKFNSKKTQTAHFRKRELHNIAAYRNRQKKRDLKLRLPSDQPQISRTTNTQDAQQLPRAAPSFQKKMRSSRRQAPDDFTRAESRDNLRATVLACNTPLVTARCISGWAARNASCAAALSPDFTASSTLRKKLRTRDLRALLRTVRFSV
jgi:hypothetical protein